VMTLISEPNFILNPSWNPVNSFHVRPEHVWNNNASIGLLEIFQNSHYGSPDGEPGTIKGMNKLYLATAFSSESYGRPAGLKILEVTAGRYLSVRILPRKPNLNVICLGGRKPQIRCAQAYCPKMNVQSF
jgi:hypothetical protein